MHLLDQMRFNDVRRIVFLSSGGTVYGNPDTAPVTEIHPLRPICSYGVVKVAIENYLFMYHDLYGIEPVVLRPSNPIGPRQGHFGIQGVVPTFLRRLLDGELIEVWGDGSVVRDYLDITDLAALCLRAGTSEVIGVFNAGSGIGTSVNDILAIIESVTGRHPEVTYSLLVPSMSNESSWTATSLDGRSAGPRRSRWMKAFVACGNGKSASAGHERGGRSSRPFIEALIREGRRQPVTVAVHIKDEGPLGRAVIPPWGKRSGDRAP